MISPARYPVFHGHQSDTHYDLFGCCLVVPAGAEWQPDSAFTLETWVWWDGTGQCQILFSKPQQRSGERWNAGLRFRMVGGMPELRVITTAGERVVSATRKIRERTWTHLAATYDGRTALLYADGAEVARNAWPQPAAVLSSDGPLLLGGELDVIDPKAFPAGQSHDLSLPGGLSEARVWRAAVGANEIGRWSQKEDLREHPNRSALVARWRLDEGCGRKAYEASSRKWDGEFRFAGPVPQVDPWHVDVTLDGGLLPGSTPTGAVDLASGRVRFTLPVAAVAELRGLGAQLTLQYDSGVEGTADTWNREAPTGCVGLGWTLLGERVLRDPRGDAATDNDTYLLVTADGAFPLVYERDDTEGQVYLSRTFPSWKIRYRPELELWTVIHEDGIRSFFGGKENTVFGDASAVEWNVSWGNWLGVSNSAAGQKRYASVWNLSGRENLQQDRVRYYYEQITQPVGVGGNERQSFTESCWLKRIVGPRGDKLQLNYIGKLPEEYDRWDEDPKVTPGADGRQDRLETRALSQVCVINEADVTLRVVGFMWVTIGSGPLVKRLLKWMKVRPGVGSYLDPGHTFYYYGEGGEGGVSASLNSPSHLYEPSTGALYGALRSHTDPMGATYRYRYTQAALGSARRDIDIQPPDNTWNSPRTYFGSDFVVVLWCGNGGEPGRMFVSVYSWRGTWLPAHLGVIRVSPNHPAEVLVSSDFFAVIRREDTPTLTLFTRDPVTLAGWRKAEFALPAPDSKRPPQPLAMGDRFFAWMDRNAGKVVRVNREGSGWKRTEEPVVTGDRTRFAMAADRDVLVTATATPTNSFPPDVRVHRLTRDGNWVVRSTRQLPHYCDAAGEDGWAWQGSSRTGIRDLQVQMGDGFATVRADHGFSNWYQATEGEYQYTQRDYYDLSSFFAHRWNENGEIVETRDLKRDLEVKDNEPRARLITVGSMVLIDHNSHRSTFPAMRYVFRYVGSGWSAAEFRHDGWKNNFIGIDCFTITRNGTAQFHEWNPAANRWEAKMPSYSDGNPTLWEKVWSYVFQLSMFLTLPLDFEIGLMIDLAFFLTDQILSQLANPDVHASRSNRYVCRNNEAFYREKNGEWKSLHGLIDEYDDRTISDYHEKAKTDRFQTQIAASFLTYSMEINRWRIRRIGPDMEETVTLPGYPKKSYWIRMLKNGGLFGTQVCLPDGESLARNDDDPCELVSSSAFATYRGGKLLQASSLHLYRASDDSFSGPVSAYVVEREAVEDGIGTVHTHYRFEGGVPLAAGGALFNKVTVTPSGSSSAPSQKNGYTEHFFYTGKEAPGAPAESNAPQYPSVLLGCPYLTRTFRAENSGPVEDSSHKLTWTVQEIDLTRQEKSYQPRITAMEDVSDGMRRVVRTEYGADGKGLPTRVTSNHKNLSGTEELRVVSYRYAWKSYPELQRQNILSAVAETRTTVNGVLTEAHGEQWAELRGPSPNPPQWQGLGYPVWAAAYTYRALDAGAEALPPTASPPEGRWQKINQVLRSAAGIPTETVDLDGVVTSLIYDLPRRNAVASVSGASVSIGGAGYLGFGPREDRSGWQIAGTDDPQRSGYTGPGCLAGPQASIRPQQFCPRAGAPFVVGAWIQTSPGGEGATLGFGANSRAVPAQPGWRWVEHTVLNPGPSDVPFVKCNGQIDCVYFGPAEAHFTAAIYEPEYGLVAAQMDGHGNVARVLHDFQQAPVVELGPGDQPVQLRFRQFNVDLPRALQGELFPESEGKKAYPNVQLDVKCGDGGAYLGPGPWKLKGAASQLPIFREAPRVPGRPDAIAAPSGCGVRFRLRLEFGAALRIALGLSVFDITERSIRFTDPKSRSQFEGDFGSDDFLLLVYGNRVLLFVGGRPLFSQEVQIPFPLILRSTAAATGDSEIRDVLSILSPNLQLSYLDGRGRVVQTQTLEPNGAGLVAAQTLYDGWGQAAVHTRPIPVEWAKGYVPGIIGMYDWSSGQLTGAVSRYYRNLWRDTPSADDAYYACTRQVRERSPLARVVESTSPGKRFAPGAGQNVRLDFSRNDDVRWLHERVALPLSEAFRAVTRQIPLAPGRKSTVVELFDLDGGVVARSAGVGQERTVVSYHAQRTANGSSLEVKPPNAYRTASPSAESLTSRSDFLGHTEMQRTPDTGETEQIYDLAGRSRFVRDAAAAECTPPRFYYTCYDEMGRPVESGRCSQPWNRAALQPQANSDRTWPRRDPAAFWLTRWTYGADNAPDGECGNGRLRMLESRGEDGEVITERYSYDQRGRVVIVEQRVPSYDGGPRFTRYSYDASDRVMAIHYPGAGGRSVYYTYNAAGLLWQVGDAGSPDRFANYQYNLDGTLAVERLNQGRYRGAFRYGAHGQLLGLEYASVAQQPLFREEIEYGEDNAGSVISATTFAASLATPRPYRYVYWYNSHNRLIRATTEPGPGIEPLTRWDLTGTNGGAIDLDPNGNILARKEGALQFTPTYGASGNRLERFAGSGQPEVTLTYDASGRLRANGVFRDGAYTGGRQAPDSLETRSGKVQFRYDGSGQRVYKQTSDRRRLYVHGLADAPLLEESGPSREETQYVYGAGGALLAYLRGGRTAFVIPDHQGSTRLLIDSEGNPLAHFNYWPFGQLQMENSSAAKEAPISYLYTGQEYDFELGCYNYKARLYDPQTYRFHCPDPVGEWFSPYAYVGNNPVNRVDPSGMLTMTTLLRYLRNAYTLGYGLFWGGVGAGVGYGVGYGIGKAAGSDDPARDGQIGAGVGAGIGMLLGGWRGRLRGFRNEALTQGIQMGAGGGQYPLVFYNFRQTSMGFNTGYLGAEMIAIGERIPPALRATHLIRTDQAAHLAIPPTASRRAIIVAHGATTGAVAKMGIQGVADANETAGQFWVSLNPATRAHIREIDLSICYAERNGFAAALRTEINAFPPGMYVPPAAHAAVAANPRRVMASHLSVSPMGPGAHMGQLRGTNNWKEVGGFITGQAYGELRPAGAVPGRYGDWVFG